MKKRNRVTVWLVAAIIFAFLPSVARAEKCLKYDPEVVTLTGKIYWKTFAGFPNYESIEAGDHKDIVGILGLEHPICVVAEPGDEDNETVDDISEIQLVSTWRDVPNWPKHDEPLKHVRVVVAGVLYTANWGFEHTQILIAVKSIKFIKGKKTPAR